MRWLSAVVVVALVGCSVSHWVHEDVHQDKTPPTRCIPPNPCFPSRQVIGEFTANITGSVYQPSDAGYAASITLSNGRLIRHPAIVVVAASESDVQKAVLFARKYFLMLTFVDNNGDADGVYSTDGSLQINLGQLKAISTNVDLLASTPDPGTVTVQPGVLWREVILAAENVGRSVVGSNYVRYNQPVGFMIQGAGVSPQSRMEGLISDTLVNARIVTMDGSVIDVSDAGATTTYVNGVTRRTTLDPGLWNAIRGGGVGSFGIVTSFTLRLVVPASSYVTHVSATYALYENDQFVGRDPLKFLIPFVYNLPDQWGRLVLIAGYPSQTTVGQKGVVNVELIHFGEYNSASYVAVNDLLNYDGSGSRLSLRVENRTGAISVASAIDFSIPPADRFYGFNTLLNSNVLTDPATLDDLVDNLLLVLNNPTVDSYYICNLEMLGGVIPQVNSSAFIPSATRNAATGLACVLRWNDNDGLRDTAMTTYAINYGLKFKALGAGTQNGYRAFYEDLEDWKTELYGENYEHLLRVKRKYDIDNFLWCHNCVASDFRVNCPRGGCSLLRDGERERGEGGRGERGHGEREHRDPMDMFLGRANAGMEHMSHHQ